MDLALRITSNDKAERIVTTVPRDSITYEARTGRSSFDLADGFRATDVWTFAWIADTRGMTDVPSFDEWVNGVYSVDIERSEPSDPTEPEVSHGSP